LIESAYQKTSGPTQQKNKAKGKQKSLNRELQIGALRGRMSFQVYGSDRMQIKVRWNMFLGGIFLFFALNLDHS